MHQGPIWLLDLLLLLLLLLRSLPPTHRKASQSDSEHAATLGMLLLGGRKSLDAKDQQKVSRSTLPTYQFTTTGSHSHMDATS